MALPPPSRIEYGFTDSSPLLDDPERLRQRATEDGYLFFRGLLPQAPVMELRRQILQIVQDHGWIEAGTPLLEGIIDRQAVAAMCESDEWMDHVGVTTEAYRQVQKLELFHALPHHPHLLKLFASLFDAPVLPHPRHIARVLLPAPRLAATPPHQDFVLIQGSPKFWTCWFPLGDCPLTLGGLSVLPGSHTEGVFEVSAAPGAGGLEAVLCGKPYRWLADDYRCGDVLTFPSHMVHRGMPNQFNDRARLSLDLRYQPAREPIEQKSLLPHADVITWEEIYSEWSDDRLKYYWQKGDLDLSPWDESLVTTRDKIC